MQWVLTELKQSKVMKKKREFRRSIVINRKIKKGEVIKKLEDIDYKRPGGEFNPSMTEFIVGRTVNKDLETDHILTKEDIV